MTVWYCFFMKHTLPQLHEPRRLTVAGREHLVALGETLRDLTARDSRLQGYINAKNKAAANIQRGNLDYLGDIGRNVVMAIQAFTLPSLDHETGLVSLRFRLNSRGAGYEELRHAIARDADLIAEEKITLLHDLRAIEKVMVRLDGFCREQLNTDLERCWVVRSGQASPAGASNVAGR